MNRSEESTPRSWRQCYMRQTIPLLALIAFGFANFLSILVLISIPVTPLFDLVHLNVNVGEVNGSLALGTFGYCLKVSGQDVCSFPHKLAYAINNTQILAQLTKNASSDIVQFSKANFVAFIFGLKVTLFFAIATKCAKSEAPIPRSLPEFTKLCPFVLMCATISALVSVVSGVVAIWFEVALITSRNQFDKSAGGGFYVTLIIFAVFLIFFAVMFVQLVCCNMTHGGGDGDTA